METTDRASLGICDLKTAKLRAGEQIPFLCIFFLFFAHTKKSESYFKGKETTA